MSGLVETDSQGGIKSETSGSRSSPWSQSSAGGALTAHPTIDPGDDVTQTDLEVVPFKPTRPQGEESQPAIAKVGFTPPRAGPSVASQPALSALPRRTLPEERAETAQMPVEDMLRQALGAEPLGPQLRDFRPFAGIDAETEAAAKEAPFPSKLGFSRIPSERPAEGTPPLTRAPAAPSKPTGPALSATRPSAAARPAGVNLPSFRPGAPRLSPDAERTLDALEREVGARNEPRPPIQPERAPVASSGPRSDDLLLNRPVQKRDRDASVLERIDLPTPALPRGFVDSQISPPRISSWGPDEPPPEETRLAAPGELAGPAPPLRAQARPAGGGEDPNGGATFAAPGELAGILARSSPGSPAAPFRIPAVEAGPTIAAPGELAGLIRDLAEPARAASPPAQPSAWERRPTESPRPMVLDRERRPPSPPPEPGRPAPSESDLLKPVALANPLDTSLPARTKTEPEASLGSIEQSTARPYGGSQRPKIAADVTRRLLPKQTLDDGQISMPGSALPPSSDTLIPALRAEHLRELVEGKDAKAAETGTLTFDVASGFRRITAVLIDGLVLAAIAGVPVVFGVFGDTLASASYIDPDQVSTLLVTGALKRPALVFAVAVLVSSALGHALAGRSLGKLVMGLEVVTRRTGRRPGPVRSIVRALLSLVSLALMAVGYLWLIVDRRSRALHDWLSGTVVVRSSSRSARASAD